MSDTLNIYWDEDFFSPGLKEINVIETNGDQVYIGGRFIKNVDGDSVNSIVLWDRLIDLYLPFGKGVFFDDGSSGVINSIKSTDNDVYIGGIFTKVLNLDNGEIPVSGIAKWNGSEWESLDITLDGSVNSIEVTNSYLIIGGDFNTLTPNFGNSITVNGIAIYNFSTNEWSPLGNGLSQSEGAFGKRINSIKATNNGFYVGGYFDKALNSDETIIDANNISFFSLNEMRWSKLGEGISEKYDNSSFFLNM